MKNKKIKKRQKKYKKALRKWREAEKEGNLKKARKWKNKTEKQVQKIKKQREAQRDPVTKAVNQAVKGEGLERLPNSIQEKVEKVLEEIKGQEIEESVLKDKLTAEELSEIEEKLKKEKKKNQ